LLLGERFLGVLELLLGERFLGERFLGVLELLLLGERFLGVLELLLGERFLGVLELLLGERFLGVLELELGFLLAPLRFGEPLRFDLEGFLVVARVGPLVQALEEPAPLFPPLLVTPPSRFDMTPLGRGMVPLIVKRGIVTSLLMFFPTLKTATCKATLRRPAPPRIVKLHGMLAPLSLGDSLLVQG